jgi:hypothetical protein
MQIISFNKNTFVHSFMINNKKMQEERNCRLTPVQHIKLNSIGNLLILVCFIICFNITWFTYKVKPTQTSEFSLTQIYMKNSS